MQLPRRWIRKLTYTGILLVFVSLLILFANKNRFIHLERFVPIDIMPLYFQPPSDAYVVDIAIRSCRFWNRNNANCGNPPKSAGLYGDVSKHESGWSKVTKDLLLGSLWIGRQYLFSKKIKPEFFERNDGQVIHLLWVGTDKDCEIKGNKDCIPFEVLKDFLNNHPFDEEDQKLLLEVNKDDRLKLHSDKSISSQKYNEDFIKEKEKEKEKEVENEKDTEQENLQKNEKEKENQEGKSNLDENASKNTNDDANENEKGPNGPRLVPRAKETSRHNLKNYMGIPSKKQLDSSGWRSLGHGIWAKYGPPNSHAVTGIDVLFGPDAVDPRPNWNLLPNPLRNTGAPSDKMPRLSFRVGPRLNYKSNIPPLKFHKGKFKVLQVADLHFSTGVGRCRDPVPAESKEGCQADPRTLKFLNEVLDLEKPDFVALTGDQVFGQEAPDPETALFKAVNPFIERKIPYGIVLGNHDDESVLSRSQMMQLALSLPYSVASLGPESVDGFGNYVVTVEKKAAFYFLDSHSYLKQPRTNPGYDWFKESQIDWVGMKAESVLASVNKDPKKMLSMAFFHIPIPEFRNTANMPMVGKNPEGVTAPRYYTDMRSAFSQAGILVASVGHDHANDYCLLNSDASNSEYQHNMWLCYGGGSGEGGYGGYGGYIRRMRVYELNAESQDVWTWKRAENNPNQVFDRQQVVQRGVAAPLITAVEEEP